MKNYILFIVFLLLTASCDGLFADSDSDAGKRAKDFAEAYFNYDFVKARKLATPESEKWLRYAASNVTQEDLDVLNSQNVPATIDIDDVEVLGDSTALATISVSDYLLRDSIGQPGRMVDEGRFTLTLVLRNGKWQVRMEGLPRSERRSRD